MCYLTLYINNMRIYVFDLWVHSMNQSMFRVKINDSGTEVSGAVRMPGFLSEVSMLPRNLSFKVTMMSYF